MYYCVLECITVYCRVYFSVLLLHWSGGWCPVELALVNLFRYTLPASSCCSSLNGWFAAGDQLEFCILLRRIDTTSTTSGRVVSHHLTLKPCAVWVIQWPWEPPSLDTKGISLNCAPIAPIAAWSQQLQLVTTKQAAAVGHNKVSIPNKNQCSNWVLQSPNQH